MPLKSPSGLIDCAIILLLLSGCGPRLPLTPTPAPVTIQFAYLKSTVDYQGLADQYHKLKPNITVNLAPLAGQDFRGAQMLEQTNADVFRWDASLMSANYLPNLLKLDNLLMLSQEFPKDDMIPGALEALRAGGVQYGIPAGINPVVAYASPKRFAAANAPLPSSVWSLDEMLALATQTNNQQGQISDANYSVGLCIGGDYSLDPLIFTFLFGGNIFDRIPDPTRITLNRPENVAAVNWYAGLTTQYGVTPKASTFAGNAVRADTNTLVEVNKCAMWLGYYADLKEGTWGTNIENRPSMLPLPTGNLKVSVVYMDGYFISAKARNALACWDWINYLIGQPEAAGAMIPPRLSQVQAETFQKAAGTDAAAVASSLPAKIVVFTQNLGDYQLLRQAFESYTGVINAVIQGQVDAQTALDQAQKAIDQGGGGN